MLDNASRRPAYRQLSTKHHLALFLSARERDVDMMTRCGRSVIALAVFILNAVAMNAREEMKIGARSIGNERTLYELS